MSNTPNSRGRNARIAALSVPDGETVATFNNYAAAVDCVDQLIRHEFPAPMVAIVGSDLRTVERVRGRLSYGRVAIQGLITGSWLGLLVSLFMPVDTSAATSSFSGSTGAAIVIGAGIGMLINILRFSFTRSRHEFTSGSAVVAANYNVVVPHSLVGQANSAIAEHLAQCVNGQAK
jgi:hypothetical protein